jgi:hypothetical protein
MPIQIIFKYTPKTLQITELGKDTLVNKGDLLARKRKSTFIPNTDIESSPLKSS